MKTLSTFDGVRLESSTIYDDGQEIKLSALAVPPDSAQALYWACWNGKAAAFDKCGSCIASLEDAVRGLIGPERNAQTMGRAYVIWTPKDRSITAFNRWAKKWKSRTASGSAY
jgi:hypothetical protein